MPVQATAEAAAAPAAPAPQAPQAVAATPVPATVEPKRLKPRHSRAEVIQPTDDGLPKRVRQTSLAPQLRDGPPPEGATIPGPSGPTRTPEELRAMMSSFQAGMVRGRREAEAADVPGGGSAEGEQGDAGA